MAAGGPAAMATARAPGSILPGAIAAVVVAWRPEPARLAQALARLAPQVDTIYLVDNSEDEAAARDIAGACASAPGCRLLPMDGNRGIAAAQNRGIDAARAAGHGWVLLSDDDSLAAPGMVASLRAAVERAAAAGVRVAAAGPLVGDVRDAHAVLVFGDTWIGPRRIAGASQAVAPMEAAFLVASGCLLRLDAVAAIGPLREDLFIDHVDLEWGLRARRAGWTLLVDPAARLEHRLGDRVLRLPVSGRPFHVHAPARNYYLVRNTLLLLRGGLLPAGWRLGYLLWLVKYLAFNLACVPPRWARARAMLEGLRDGLAGRSGARPTIIRR